MEVNFWLLFCYCYQTLIKVDDQDRELQISKVKTGNIGMLCYITNKIYIVIVLKKAIKLGVFIACVSQKIKESRIFYIILHILLSTSYLYFMSR